MKRLVRLLDERTILLSLLLAWLGGWGAWIPHKTAALTQNAYTLAEWSTFLTDVRFGALTLVPDILRLGLALMGVALAVAAAQIDRWWLRWALRGMVLLPGLLLLPPYPAVLQLWRAPGYGTRFMVAMVLWLGVPLSGLVDRLPLIARRILLMMLSVGAVAAALWAVLSLRPPFQAHYAGNIAPGWGLVVFVLGLTVTFTIALMQSLQSRDPAAA